MSKSFRFSGLVAGAVLVLATASCAIAPAKVAMPEGFVADGAGYPVDGHRIRYAGKPVVFGPYRTTDVRGSGAPTTWTLGGEPFAIANERRSYAFRLIANGGGSIDARCLSSIWSLRLNADELTVSIPDQARTPVLGCDFSATGVDSALRLWSSGDAVVGWLRDGGGVEYRIESLHRLEGTRLRMGEPVGYRFERNGRIVAVIDVADAGHVHFAPGLDAAERVSLAATAAALLMLA